MVFDDEEFDRPLEHESPLEIYKFRRSRSHSVKSPNIFRRVIRPLPK